MLPVEGDYKGAGVAKAQDLELVPFLALLQCSKCLVFLNAAVQQRHYDIIFTFFQILPFLLCCRGVLKWLKLRWSIRIGSNNLAQQKLLCCFFPLCVTGASSALTMRVVPCASRILALRYHVQRLSELDCLATLKLKVALPLFLDLFELSSYFSPPRFCAGKASQGWLGCNVVAVPCGSSGFISYTKVAGLGRTPVVRR